MIRPFSDAASVALAPASASLADGVARPGPTQIAASGDIPADRPPPVTAPPETPILRCDGGAGKGLPSVSRAGPSVETGLRAGPRPYGRPVRACRRNRRPMSAVTAVGAFGRLSHPPAGRRGLATVIPGHEAYGLRIRANAATPAAARVPVRAVTDRRASWITAPERL